MEIIFILCAVTIVLIAGYYSITKESSMKRPKFIYNKPRVWIYSCSGDVIPTPVVEEYGRYFAEAHAGYVSQRFQLLPQGKVTQGALFQCAKSWEPMDGEIELRDLFDGGE